MVLLGGGLIFSREWCSYFRPSVCQPILRSTPFREDSFCGAVGESPTFLSDATLSASACSGKTNKYDCGAEKLAIFQEYVDMFHFLSGLAKQTLNCLFTTELVFPNKCKVQELRSEESGNPHSARRAFSVGSSSAPFASTDSPAAPSEAW